MAVRFETHCEFWAINSIDAFIKSRTQTIPPKPMKTIRFNKWLAVAALPALMTFADTAHAASYLLGNFVNGTPIPAPIPSAIVTLTNSIGGGVDLTLSLSGPSSSYTTGEFISSLYMNFGNPTGGTPSGPSAADASTLTFTANGSSGLFTMPTISLGPPNNNYDSHSGAYPQNFDIQLQFDSGSGGPSSQFGLGESVSYHISSASPISENWFLFTNNTLPTDPTSSPNAPYSGTNVFAIDVQGYTSSTTGTTTLSSIYGNSGIAIVPEPSAGILSILTATACTVFARKRRDLKA